MLLPLQRHRRSNGMEVRAMKKDWLNDLDVLGQSPLTKGILVGFDLRRVPHARRREMAI